MRRPMWIRPDFFVCLFVCFRSRESSPSHLLCLLLFKNWSNLNSVFPMWSIVSFSKNTNDSMNCTQEEDGANPESAGPHRLLTLISLPRVTFLHQLWWAKTATACNIVPIMWSFFRVSCWLWKVMGYQHINAEVKNSPMTVLNPFEKKIISLWK